MALTPLVKKTYVYGIDPVSSSNLNAIQDAVIQMQNNYTDPDDVGDISDLTPAANNLVEAVNTAQNEIETITDNIAAPYSNMTTYAIGDYCIHEYTLYRCITPISTAEDWTPAHWTAVTVISELETLQKTKTCVVLTPTFTSLPQTFTDGQLTFLSYVDHVTEDMIVGPSDYIASHPSAMSDDWVVTAENGLVRVEGTFIGSTGTNLKLYFSYI